MKKKERTSKEIKAMIEKLENQKNTLPEFNFFGDNNWLAINIQIDVLNGEITTEDQVYDQRDEGELDSNTVSSAIDAFLWLNGEMDSLVDD